MTERLRRLSAERFAEHWNGSGSLDEASVRVKSEVGTPCPRWAVLARAVALREQGMHLKAMPKAADVR